MLAPVFVALCRYIPWRVNAQQTDPGSATGGGRRVPEVGPVPVGAQEGVVLGVGTTRGAGGGGRRGADIGLQHRPEGGPPRAV